MTKQEAVDFARDRAGRKPEKASEQVIRERRERKIKMITRRIRNNPEGAAQFRRMNIPEPITRAPSVVQKLKATVKQWWLEKSS